MGPLVTRGVGTVGVALAGVDAGSVATLLVAALASLFMAWVIGAGSSGATPFAPAVGANAISILRAGFVVGVLGFAGAVLQGQNVSATVGEGLVHGVSLSPIAVIVTLLTAAGLMAVGIRTGIPIATAFTVPGVVVGTGLAIGGTPAWDTYWRILAVWLLTPVVGGGLAYGLARTLADDAVPEAVAIPLLGGAVGAVVANVRFSALGPGSATGSLAEVLAMRLPEPAPAETVLATLALAVLVAGVLRWETTRNEERALRHFLLALGSLVAFAAGGSQVGLAVGPLLPLLDQLQVSTTMVLVGGGLGMLVGSWTGAPRMIQSLAREYSSLGPRRSISALVPSFAIAQAAVFLGVPVSFNEIIVSAIVGSGMAVGGAGVSRRKLLRTVGAWVGSFVLAFAVGYGGFSVVG
jgi:PiT family inorganic phosphate transporter